MSTTMAHRVGHCSKDGIAKDDESVVYAGRRNVDGTRKHLNNTQPGEPGWLGNPYPLDEGYDREESVALFVEDLLDRVESDPEFRQKLWELKQRDVDFGCWCQTFAEDGPMCHAEAIAKVVEGMEKVA